MLEKAKKQDSPRAPTKDTWQPGGQDVDRLRYEPVETCTSARQFDVVRRGNPLGNASIPTSFECIDFHGLSQIIASLTLENLAEREAEMENLLGHRQRKTKCKLGFRALRAKKPMLCLHAVTDEDGHPLKNEEETSRKQCDFWSTIFQTRAESPRQPQKKYPAICSESSWRHPLLVSMAISACNQAAPFLAHHFHWARSSNAIKASGCHFEQPRPGWDAPLPSSQLHAQRERFAAWIRRKSVIWPRLHVECDKFTML